MFTVPTAAPPQPPFRASAYELARDLPALSPEPPVWQLPGRYRQWPQLTEGQRAFIQSLGFDPNLVAGTGTSEAVLQERLKVVEAELVQPRAVPPGPFMGSGAGDLVLRLSPPAAPPRAIVQLRDGYLYLVERKGSEWRTERVGPFRPDVVDALDVDGDGRPEIVAARSDGSGAFLTLAILSWDATAVRQAFYHHGASEPGLFGFYDAEGDGRRELWIDTAAGSGLFAPETHGPFLRDRLTYRWMDGTYRQVGHFRFATPFYHLNRYLLFASQGNWRKAARHVEPGAKIDGRLAASLGAGPFTTSRIADVPFVDGRINFNDAAGRKLRADFGPTGRLLRLERVTQ